MKVKMENEEEPPELLLGTRGSALALAQTAMVKQALAESRPDLKLGHRVIKTVGDQRQDLKLSEFSRGESPVVDKGIFTRELDAVLEAGETHASVHSLKDVPTERDEGFEISAVLPRASVEDVLISKHAGGFAGLPVGGRVATSSVRRQAQLRLVRPDLIIEDIRGNVPTRLRKLVENPDLDAILLARAGLQRLELLPESATRLTTNGAELEVEILDPTEFLPAASQGAVAIETYRADPALRGILQGINDGPTMTRIRAERHFLLLLGAGCQTPVGVFTTLRENGAALHMRAVVFDEHGNGPPMRGQAEGASDDPEAVAVALQANLSSSSPQS